MPIIPFKRAWFQILERAPDYKNAVWAVQKCNLKNGTNESFLSDFKSWDQFHGPLVVKNYESCTRAVPAIKFVRVMVK